MGTNGDLDSHGAATLSRPARIARGLAVVVLSAAVLVGSLMAVRAIGDSGATAAQGTAIGPSTTPGNEALVLPRVKRLDAGPRVAAKQPAPKRRAAASRSSSSSSSS
jgi:hypothetical protein